ncbi:hypothetical protein [Enterococcus sp. HY326]|uniref:hypothetical protein n=1 Tax=Enterococcus sp. HY326 TaxID=2971265 RepID=UPI002240160C|nr:hypothetical protein [Enterococcus sp. HY326]
MKERKYIDIEGMKKRADAELQARVEESKNRMRKQQEAYIKKREEDQSLFNKTLESMHTKNEKKREIEAEKEKAKAKAIAEVEAKYESKGVKSTKQMELENSYRNLLGGLKGLDD